MKEKLISGIQQIGIGVPDVRKAWKWYIKAFGVDIRMFEDKAVAEHMLPYTGGKPQKRHAALALNMQGGGGFEIWQYVERTPLSPGFEIQLGDLGIMAAKIKCHNAKATYDMLKSEGTTMLSGVLRDPRGKEHFFIKDPYNNIFQLVTSKNWFRNEKKLTGAAYGAVIGVSDIEKARSFYAEILGYDEVIFDETSVFGEYAGLPGGNNRFRRVLLRPGKPRLGAFSPVFGTSEIELVQVLDREPRKIYHERFWGDLGFIHLCFDIRGMNLLREECKKKGCPFTVDVDHSFDMGEAAGSFSYTEDPDGTLIEFVETHKIPILKSIGWYLHLRNRRPDKALPRWLLNALSFNRAKDI
ncbi:MAG TPA: VOC family protein [Bacteroidales bacterium]|nr:VOC family protein [Bacteroidales bacterium]